MLAQIGAFALPALLPGYIARWDLSKTEAGWLVGIFFAAYVVMVPVLVALTDRVPARRVYMLGTGLTALSHLGFALLADGFWSALVLRVLAGIGWAGTYMPGLKAIADPLEGMAQSRAVSWHAAGVGISGAASFAIAGLVDAIGRARAAAFCSAARPRWRRADRRDGDAGGVAAPAADGRRRDALLDFRPVFRNRAAMGWIVGYTVHTWELAALRAWGVTFLAAVIARAGAPAWLPDPTVLFTVAGLAGIAVSITGNETAQRWGRARVVTVAMSTAAVLVAAGRMERRRLGARSRRCWSCCGTPRFISTARRLTAGTVQAADKELRGATMGLHSMCGYAGGFIGPLGVGLVLDWTGSAQGWGLAFGHLALITLTGLFVLRRLGARSAMQTVAASSA